jgi:hypothetical protein
MITEKEISEVSLSPTKKDYYQIWNELMELADKLSDRWSPESTNESDPGIVLLKALTAIADKLNYNIDKNTLEAFMPSATQEESMRKLTEMMGYSMKYYRAATCTALISFKDANDLTIGDFETAGGIYFPKFVNLKNKEEDINYVTLEDFTLKEAEPSRSVAVAEGELIECETDNDNIVSLTQLDDSKRYILPEAGIAENGVFVINISDDSESALWKQVDNLNTQLPGSCVYKFGFDSKTSLPYLQFPDDIDQLIEDGLRIRYIRTNGAKGNISARTLSKLEIPSLWSTASSGTDSSYANIASLTADNFSVTNTSAATNGANPESLTDAYNGYKKIIGTFDTLVTCRDYMNKILQLTKSDTDTTPLVSNAVVSDIRDDINRATPLCSFNEYGISYDDVALKDDSGKTMIDNFDLMLYPFKTVYGLDTQDEYENSFKYNAENNTEILNDIKDAKTISHNFKAPAGADIACIKNYLRLKAKITTTKKVTSGEEATILQNVYTAIYANFNAHKIDFGEEIPYDTILSVIENADSRIKDVNLDEPTLYTMIEDVNGNEYDVTSSDDDAKAQYNKLMLRNILAGRIAAFQYDSNFKTDYSESKYSDDGVKSEYPENPSTEYISKMTSKFEIPAGSSGRTLKENEVVQFRRPNFKTTITYPAYVNYYLHLTTAEATKNAIPATFETIRTFMSEASSSGKQRWEDFVNAETVSPSMTLLSAAAETSSAKTYDDAVKLYGAIFAKSAEGVYSVVTEAPAAFDKAAYYVFEFTEGTYAKFYTWIKSQVINGVTLSGVYRSLGADTSRVFGKYIDIDLIKYTLATTVMTQSSTARLIDNRYIQKTSLTETADNTKDGLGSDANNQTVSVNSDYQLKAGEYLLINYTDSSTTSDGTETKKVINKYYGPDTVISPNFAVMSSELYHVNHSYSKKDNYYFAQVPECPGMFTLGTNEQICIRELVSVELDEAGTNIYWERNDEIPDSASQPFEFDESWDNGTNNAYTLKDGEHLYYTDAKKTDIAYYGAGTTIIKITDAGNDIDLTKKTADGDVSEEDIMTYGLAASIPWKQYNFSSTHKLKIVENQYISLTEGDTINSLSNSGSDNNGNIALDLDNEWKSVVKANYKFAEKDTSEDLPEVSFSSTSGIAENNGWKVRSRLDFNMSTTTAQTLHAGDSITLFIKNISDISTSPDKATTRLLAPTQGDLSINSNYVCQSATDSVTTVVSGYDLAANPILRSFKVKITSKNTPKIAATTKQLTLNNYENNGAKFTKFNFSDLKDISGYTAATKAFNLSINIPSTSQYGLIMFFYKNNDTTTAAKPYLRAKNAAADVSGIKKFNTSAEMAATYTLQEGINVIQVSKTVTAIEVYPDANLKGMIVFGELSPIVDINYKLNYKYDTTTITTAQGRIDALMKDIANTHVADDFYYNVPINSDNAIELNQLIADDTLASPLTWYDANNVNNKFVISEIDADYLSTGITLSRASKA